MKEEKLIQSIIKQAEKVEYKYKWTPEFKYSITVYKEDGDKEHLSWLDEKGVKLFKKKFPKETIAIAESNDGHTLDDTRMRF